MVNSQVNIDKLIKIVEEGGTVKTGVDVYTKNGLLLIDKDVPVNDTNTLLKIEKYGIKSIPVIASKDAGLWDKDGKRIDPNKPAEPGPTIDPEIEDVRQKLQEVISLKREAAVKYKKAKGNVQKVISDIKSTGGVFDYQIVEETVTDLLSFLTKNDSGFSYLTKEIFSYDDYLYNHCVNVCTIGSAVINRYAKSPAGLSSRYFSDELKNIATGFFLHDIGKVLIPDTLLNKNGRFTDNEFEMVKTHSFEKGIEILHKNGLTDSYIHKIVRYHHTALYDGEERCYPMDLKPSEVPPYVKICKLSDIYDAMTSKRAYKDAFNPIGVITNLFRSYANKDKELQLILHSFVKIVGIYPPGSIVELNSGQLAFVLDSDGPTIIPFTNNEKVALGTAHDPLNLKDTLNNPSFHINTKKPLVSPKDAYKLVPEYLKEPLINDLKESP